MNDIVGKTVASVEVKTMAGRDTFKDAVTWERKVITFTDETTVQFDSWDGEVYGEYEYDGLDDNEEPIEKVDPEEIFTPIMGWLSCRYKYMGREDGIEWYHCLIHDTENIGHQTSCEKAGEGDQDLPEGYRWATADESEAHTTSPNPKMVVVPRTVDRDGTPYTQGEADLALPIETSE